MTETCPICKADILSTSQPNRMGTTPEMQKMYDEFGGEVPRCEICDWPLASDQSKGCVPGDCSYRPDDPAEQERIRKRRAALAATPAVGGEDARTEALRVISTLAICEDGETAEQRALIVDACREVAANALAAQPASTLRGREWQPIETKPRDHFAVLVFGEYGRYVAFLDVTWTWFAVGSDKPLDWIPTHWMPLPDRPRSRNASNKESKA